MTLGLKEQLLFFINEPLISGSTVIKQESMPMLPDVTVVTSSTASVANGNKVNSKDDVRLIDNSPLNYIGEFIVGIININQKYCCPNTTQRHQSSATRLTPTLTRYATSYIQKRTTGKRKETIDGGCVAKGIKRKTNIKWVFMSNVILNDGAGTRINSENGSLATIGLTDSTLKWTKPAEIRLAKIEDIKLEQLQYVDVNKNQNVIDALSSVAVLRIPKTEGDNNDL
ncbi:hypothetical protein CHS0354_032686 [Potamilus streckersoni]|uniref:Uncharacterized protein n=1 Tax=Potamilus streckersoni TaxID=2493646 RepID=A0AAE0SQT2_9BIVA|nr:hypothetical protein CHS0354_032686 [Potamilus streckersoni]